MNEGWTTCIKGRTSTDTMPRAGPHEHLEQQGRSYWTNTRERKNCSEDKNNIQQNTNVMLRLAENHPSPKREVEEKY